MTEEAIWVCRAGETFDLVALKAYGHERYAADILAANPAMCRTLVFAGGEELFLPAVEVQPASAIMPAKAPWK